MDEEISIIDSQTRNQKIKNFLIEKKKILAFSLLFIIFVVLGFYSYQLYLEKQKEKISDDYNSAIIEYKSVNETQTIESMIEIVKNKDKTYSPLALYFLLDNNLLKNNEEINDLFDVLINKTNLDFEIKNLIIYKKALYNSDQVDENVLLNILSPITSSESIWKSHALYLIGEYFFSKNEKNKSREFFEKIMLLKNANEDIILATQKRLNRDLSE
tara:strand:- start:613 stop:1257 length:645 start_codon:yes stop_codon:yes gene_type:complete